MVYTPSPQNHVVYSPTLVIKRLIRQAGDFLLGMRRLEVVRICNGIVELLVLRTGGVVYYIDPEAKEAYESFEEAVREECPGGSDDEE